MTSNNNKICQIVAIVVAILLQLSPALSFSSSPLAEYRCKVHGSSHEGRSTQPFQQQQQPVQLLLQQQQRKRRTAIIARTATVEDGETTEALPSKPKIGKQKAMTAMKAEFDDDMVFLVSYELQEHKPLGCTVEETVVEDCNYVFVSKLVPGGLAAQAGLQVGDVLIATNAMFGGGGGGDDESKDDLTILVKSGVDQIKSVIGSMPADEPLQLAVARGTDVLQEHEDYLVELCSAGGPSDKEVECSIEKFLSEGYYSESTSATMDDDDLDDEDAIVVDGGDDLVADMNNLWAEELPPPPSLTDSTNDQQQRDTAKSIKPWSSRSSPSGTFVRDPVTGEMKNIDSTDWSNGSGGSSSMGSSSSDDDSSDTFDSDSTTDWSNGSMGSSGDDSSGIGDGSTDWSNGMGSSDADYTES